MGKRTNSRRRKIVLLGAALLIVVIGATALYLRHLLQPDTTITQSPPHTAVVKANDAPTHVFKQGVFQIEFPVGWRQVASAGTPNSPYSWQSNASGSSKERIDIYVDNLPGHFGVNKALVVQAQGNGLTLNGQVSDNCANYTKPDSKNADQTAVPAKWQGVDFLCDLGNYERDVVGTSSPTGVNEVTVRGKTAGAHRFFFVYTDHTLNPDYTTFYNSLLSFRVN